MSDKTGISNPARTRGPHGAAYRARLQAERYAEWLLWQRKVQWPARAE